MDSNGTLSDRLHVAASAGAGLRLTPREVRNIVTALGRGVKAERTLSAWERDRARQARNVMRSV